jgi:hypothetical protein
MLNERTAGLSNSMVNLHEVVESLESIRRLSKAVARFAERTHGKIEMAQRILACY